MLGFFRAILFAAQNLARNFWLSTATVILVTLATFSILLVASLTIIGNQIIGAIEERVDMDYYFYSQVPEAQVLEAQTFLKTLPQVAEVVYISPEAALEDFRATHANDPELLASLEEFQGEAALPATLLVRAYMIEDYGSIQTAFAESPYGALVQKTDTVNTTGMIGKFEQLIERIRRLGIGVSVVFILIALIVMLNTIRLTIYNHREELGIMKLVGATNWFIRAPFMLEGVLVGLSSALIAFGIFYLGVYVSRDMMNSFFTGYDFSLLTYVNRHLFQFLFGTIVTTILVSTTASAVAMNRYLRV